MTATLIYYLAIILVTVVLSSLTISTHKKERHIDKMLAEIREAEIAWRLGQYPQGGGVK